MRPDRSGLANKKGQPLGCPFRLPTPLRQNRNQRLVLTSPRPSPNGEGACNIILTCALGSTSLVTDASGQVISQTKYKAWGEVRQATGTSPINYTYTGQYSYTADFGLMYYNARWYDPALGRFAQADTIIPGGVQGLDRYAYVNNNPIHYTDPDGHNPLIALLVAAVKVVTTVVDIGWTAYDVVTASSVYLDKDATQEMRDDATATIAMAIAFEAMEPDEASPVALPLDDIARHSDDVADIYNHAVQNPDSSLAVLGSFTDNYKGFAENIPDGATHLFTDKYDEFIAIYGKDGWWKYINDPFVQNEIIDKGKSVFTTTTKEVIDKLDSDTSFLKREINKLLDAGYTWTSNRGLVPK